MRDGRLRYNGVQKKTKKEHGMTEVFEIIPQAESVAVYSDGAKSEFPAGSTEFAAIVSGWTKMTEGAHQMPAFGVSIDKLTREEMKTGNWVEFYFSPAQHSNGLPFDSLLMTVRAEYRGVNLVRGWEGLYQGRCIYVDLGRGDMSALSAALEGIRIE